MRKCWIKIGTQTAKEIKERIGEDQGSVVVRGIELESRSPRSVEISAFEIQSVLDGPIQQIVDLTTDLIEDLPPEMAADLIEHGIMLSGGGALHARIGAAIRRRTGLNVSIAKEPQRAVVRGCELLLSSGRAS